MSKIAHATGLAQWYICDFTETREMLFLWLRKTTVCAENKSNQAVVFKKKDVYIPILWPS